MLLARNQQRGDTLIEVILACAIFAMVTVSTFAIMQRASSNTYDAMERSQVRLLLNGQAELLQYARDSYVDALASGASLTSGQAAAWNTVSNAASYNTSAPNIDACLPNPPATIPSAYFYIDQGPSSYIVKNGSSISGATGLPEPGKGIWIQRVDGNGAASKRYKEFYIMACWQNTTNGTQHMSSVVRMYDPN